MKVATPVKHALRVGVAAWLGITGVAVAQAAPAGAPSIPAGTIGTLMGLGRYNGDNRPATMASISMQQGDGITGIGRHDPGGIDVDSAGNIYIGDRLNNRVRKVDGTTGMISTLAGTGAAAFTGDGGPANKAALNDPRGVRVFPDGSVYIADAGNGRVRRVTPDGNISTVAGTTTKGIRGNGGQATTAQLNTPQAIEYAKDGSGTWYIVDIAANQVRRVDKNGIISVLAGQGAAGGFSGDGGPAANAKLSVPTAIAAVPDGSVFILEGDNQRVRRIDTSGNIWTSINVSGTRLGAGTTTVVGTGSTATVGSASKLVNVVNATGDIAGNTEFDPGIRPVSGNTSGLASGMQFDRPKGLAAGPDGSLYLADSSGQRIIALLNPAGAQRLVAQTSGGDFNVVPGDLPSSTAAVTENSCFSSGATANPGTATCSPTNYPLFRWYRLAGFSASGLQPDTGRYISAGVPQPGNLGDGGQARSSFVRFPNAIAVGPDGSVYFLDQGNLSVRKITNPGPNGTIDRVVGGYSGQTGSPAVTQLLNPRGIAVAADGTVYVGDSDSARVRKVTSDGTLQTTIAGTGTKGDDCGTGTPCGIGEMNSDRPGSQMRVSYPVGVEAAPDGSVYFVDKGSQRVKRVNPDGTMVHIAGNGQAGFESTIGGSPEGAYAQGERLNYPTDVAYGTDGALYISDTVNSRVRKVTGLGDPTSAKIYTVAGTGNYDYSGEGGPGISAALWQPTALFAGRAGTQWANSIFIADAGNSCIRRLDITPGGAGNITTFAGICSQAGFSGDGGAATAATINIVATTAGAGDGGLAGDLAGNIFISDTNNQRIRKVDPSGNISTIVGTGTAGEAGDGADATKAQVRNPKGIAWDRTTNSLLIADTDNQRIRIVKLP